jgi:hypothetical protein
MPIQNRYNHGDTLFGRSPTGDMGKVRHLNNAPKGNGGVDSDTQNVGGGICSGITSSWILGLLNANHGKDYCDAKKFPSVFSTLRFQGAYFKELHGTSENHLQKMGEVTVTNGEKDRKIETKVLTSGQLPTSQWWGAYVSMRGHAIGCGRFEGNYHIMDPNFGLYSYRKEPEFLSDLNDLVRSYMSYKGKADQDAVFIFYKRKTGGTTQ